MRHLQKIPKQLESPRRLPENSDETWLYIEPFNTQMLKIYQMISLKYAMYYIANSLLEKKTQEELISNVTHSLSYNIFRM